MKKLIFIIIALFLMASTAFAIPPSTAAVGSGTGDITQAGTTSNHQWAYFTADKTLAGVTITASKPVCSDANGNPAVCAGTEGVWQVAGSYLASTVLDDTKGNGDTTYLWSADKIYDQLALKLGATAKAADADTLDGHDTSYFQTALGTASTGIPYCTYSGGCTWSVKAIGTDIQAYHASLASITTLTESVGGTFYATDDDTWAVLAKGTAYQIKHMNSGATAPEWTSTLGAAGTPLTAAYISALYVSDFYMTKESGVAGKNCLYQANSTDTYGWCDVGPATKTSAYDVNFIKPSEEPTAGDVLANSAPDGSHNVTQTWVNPVLGALGATTNKIPKTSGTGGKTLQASGITENGTDVDIGALNLVATGSISGAIPRVVKSDSTNSITAAQALGSLVLLTYGGASDLTLPDYTVTESTSKAKFGSSVCVMAMSAYGHTIHPSSTDKIRTSNGTLNAVGAGITYTTASTPIGGYTCFLLTDAPVKGTAAGATTDTTGYATTTTTITLASAGTGTILIGDVITFEGDTTQYTVTSGDADVSGGGTITFTPGLETAIETSAHAITIVESAIGIWTQMGTNGTWPIH